MSGTRKELLNGNDFSSNRSIKIKKNEAGGEVLSSEYCVLRGKLRVRKVNRSLTTFRDDKRKTG